MTQKIFRDYITHESSAWRKIIGQIGSLKFKLDPTNYKFFFTKDDLSQSGSRALDSQRK